MNWLLSIYRKIKCRFGFHDYGNFWKDGWIPPQMKTKYLEDGFTREFKVCTYCGHKELK